MVNGSLSEVESISEYSPWSLLPCINCIPRAGNKFNQVAEAKKFEGMFLCRKVC